MGIDALLGASVMEIYGGFKNAAASGAELGVNEYAAFVSGMDKSLTSRKAGKAVAMKIGEEYAAKHYTADDMVHRMSTGAYKADIDAIIAKDELAATAPAAIAKPAPVAPTVIKQAPTTMVNRIGSLSERPERAVLGPHTGKIKAEQKGMVLDAPSMGA